MVRQDVDIEKALSKRKKTEKPFEDAGKHQVTVALAIYMRLYKLRNSDSGVTC